MRPDVNSLILATSNKKSILIVTDFSVDCSNHKTRTDSKADSDEQRQENIILVDEKVEISWSIFLPHLLVIFYKFQKQCFAKRNE